MKTFALNVIFIVLAVYASKSWSEIYKWIDAQGRTHYSEIPPADQNQSVEKIQQRGSNSTASPPSPRDGVDRYSKYLESERLEREQLRQQEEAELAKAKSRCEELRRTLADYQAGGVIYYDLDENGERVFWTDQRLRSERESVERAIKKNCNGL